MLQGFALDQAINQLGRLSRPGQATAYRAVLGKYLRDPLGKNRPVPVARGRFNVAGGARVLYLADSPPTCLAEVQAYGSLPAGAVTIFALHFNLKAAISVLLPAVRQLLHLTMQELTSNFRSLPLGSPPAETQELGERIAALGCIDGLVFPSVANPGGKGLAIFEGSLAKLGSSVMVDDLGLGIRDQLP